MNTMQIDSLCWYASLFDDPFLSEFKALLTASDPDACKQAFFRLRAQGVQAALTIKEPLAPCIWQHKLLAAITADSPLNRALEANESIPFAKTLLTEIDTLAQLYQFNFTPYAEDFTPGLEELLTRPIFTAEPFLTEAFESNDHFMIINALADHFKSNGLGRFAGNKLFHVRLTGGQKSVLHPVRPRAVKRMDELVGYENQKKQLIRNTKSFIDGKGGLNALLYGDMGTGKSTMVKALTMLFSDTPLRFIELPKDRIDCIPRIYEEVRHAPYPFILFMDDLSFDSGNTGYTALKNALQGSLEDMPSNLLIYATSNRRSLVAQSKSEREDAVNAKELLEEKLSLTARFGLMLSFTVPDKRGYLDIVKVLAEAQGIAYTEQLEADAMQWELRHLNKSGRTADQFIQYVLTEHEGEY